MVKKTVEKAIVFKKNEGDGAGEQILTIMLGYRDNLEYDNGKVRIFIYALR
jgi:hypothetical protein